VLSGGGWGPGPLPERAVADRMHGLEIGVGLASEPRQRWRRRERLGKGRFDAIAEGCRACGERDAIEEITPRDWPVHAKPAIVRTSAHVFAGITRPLCGLFHIVRKRREQIFRADSAASRVAKWRRERDD